MTIKNRHYFFVFQPKKELGYANRRFAVSKNKLENYIGPQNADTVLQIASNLSGDKHRRKFRKFGTVDIYHK